MDPLRIGIVGAAGRMGRMVALCAHETDGCVVAGGTEQPGSDAVGRDLGTLAGIGTLGVAVGDDPAALFAAVDAVIDFTAPAATVAHAALAAQSKTVHIIGTTGLGPDDLAAIERAAQQTAIMRAPNMSLGVNLLMGLAEQVAGALDADYDIEILEMHHRHKVDAPSGTALGLGQAVAAGRGVDLDAVAQRTRDGITGARRRGDIGFATLRGGDVVGDHAVIFAAPGERIELTHKASSREIYARGAIRAALWACGKPPGLYAMTDVLGIG